MDNIAVFVNIFCLIVGLKLCFINLSLLKLLSQLAVITGMVKNTLNTISILE